MAPLKPPDSIEMQEVSETVDSTTCSGNFHYRWQRRIVGVFMYGQRTKWQFRGGPTKFLHHIAMIIPSHLLIASRGYIFQYHLSNFPLTFRIQGNKEKGKERRLLKHLPYFFWSIMAPPKPPGSMEMQEEKARKPKNILLKLIVCSIIFSLAISGSVMASLWFYYIREAAPQVRKGRIRVHAYKIWAPWG